MLLLFREVPTVLIHNLLYVRMSSTPAKAASQQNHFISFVKFCQILIFLKLFQLRDLFISSVLLYVSSCQGGGLPGECGATCGGDISLRYEL